jgi:PAP2 superfamily
VRRLIDSTGSRLPHGWGDALKQLGLFALAYSCYQIVRGIAEGKAAAAFQNAHQLVDIERGTGTFFEPGLQHSLLSHRWIIDIVDHSYLNTHFVLTTTFLIWLYVYRNSAFYFVRNMFLFAMGLALIGYTLYPAAPPRLLPHEGFVDTVTQVTGVNHDTGLFKDFVNPYAAVPSMHCAFALMIGIPGALLARSKVAKVLWSIYPVFVFFVVVATANHYWLDGAAGALVALVAAAASYRLAQMRPASWGWRQAPAQARA